MRLKGGSITSRKNKKPEGRFSCVKGRREFLKDEAYRLKWVSRDPKGTQAESSSVPRFHREGKGKGSRIRTRTTFTGRESLRFLFRPGFVVVRTITRKGKRTLHSTL